MRSWPLVCTLSLGGLVAASTMGQAQSSEATDTSLAAPRRGTLLGGIGNAFGWVGAQGELYFAAGRLSAFGGLGYTPRVEAAAPTGPAGAAGLRAYTAGDRHRGFLEISFSQVAVQLGAVPSRDGTHSGPKGRHLYGPGTQAGYQYVARGGFTAMASTGIGYILADPPPGFSRWEVQLNLGVGYTWR